MDGNTAIRTCFRIASLYSFGLLLFSLFAIYTDIIGLVFIVPVALTLATTAAARYTALYHQFRRSLYRKILAVSLSVAMIISGTGTSYLFSVHASIDDARGVFHHSPPRTDFQTFLPEWWIAPLLVVAGVLALVGVVVEKNTDPYPKPTEIGAVAQSPVYFGFVCTVFGLWAVLFVGISVQRVVIVAPIFEELLKFGVALLVGASLFGRSTAARVGVAAVAGLSFGLIEHATTYPTEADAVYLYRSLFHTVTPMLSVSIYTMFESKDRYRLLWLAPTFSILFHFFYNTFAVLSGIGSVVLFGGQATKITLVYGGVAILLVTVLLVLSWGRHRAIDLLHEPFEHVLSDLV